MSTIPSSPSTSIVPALRQSTVETMSCPASYVQQAIREKKMPSGLQSQRGQEIHRVMSSYIDHCAAASLGTKWEKFDELAVGALQDSVGILNGLRDCYIVDFEHVYATELTLGCTLPDMESEGTLDVLLFPTSTQAKIEDFKSHPRPFEPDTFQSKLYSFLVMHNFPRIEEVTFELNFVRYANCRRSVTFTRQDMPGLRQQITNARARQVLIHRQEEEGLHTHEAFAGSHCQYCPLLHDFQCPIAEFNPHASVTPESRLQWAIWMQQAKKINDQVLRDIVDASGRPVQTRDANGRLSQIGIESKESCEYPLLATLPFIFDHRDTYPEDVAWIDNLRISSTKLKSYLGAKKRAITHQAIQDNAAVRVSKPKFSISMPAESDESVSENDWED